MATQNEIFIEGVEAALRSLGCSITDCTNDEAGCSIMAKASTGEEVRVRSSAREIRANMGSKSQFVDLVNFRIQAAFKKAA